MFVNLFAITFFAALGMAGCGGSSPKSVAVTASSSTVDGTDSTKLTATVTNDSNSAGVSWTVSGGGTLSGTSISSATYTAPAATSSAQTATVTATSIADTTKSASATINVPAAPAITTTTLMGNVGVAFSSTLVATGGISPYTWTLTSGTLPTGWNLSAAGVVSGAAPMAAQAGTSNLTFALSDSGTPNALTATQPVTLTIAPAPAIAFSGVMPATATYNTAYSGSAAAGGGAGALAYSVSGGAMPGGLSLNAASGAVTGTPTAVGVFNFSISAADAFGDSKSQAYTITVATAAQTITFANPGTQTVGTPLTLSATASSGLAVSFASTTTAVCTVAGTTATMVTSGSCNIQATQAGNANYAAATPVAQSFTVNGQAQTITFANPGVQTVGAPLTLSATSSSGLTVSFASTTASVCTVAGTAASMVASGTCTIQATQAGNSTFAAATAVAQSFTVNGQAQTITFANPGAQYVGTPLTLSATASSSLAVSFASTTASVCTVAGTTATMLTGGTCTIQATQAGDSTYAAATPVLQSFTVEAALAINPSTTMPTGVVGTAYSQPLTATGGTGTYTWSLISGATQLAGIGLTFNPATATLAGATPIAGGPFSFTVQVADTGGHQMQATLSVTINASLAIATGTLSPNYVYTASSYSQTITALGGTAPYTWSVSSGGAGLAAIGLSLSTGTGLSNTISGSVPANAATGPVNFTVQVKDANNVAATQTYTLTVYGALTLTSSSTLPATGYTGVAYSGTITATGGSGTYSWTVTGLSDSLIATPSGSLLTIGGTPASAATVTFSVKLTDTATNTSITQPGYSIVISNPTPVTLPTTTTLPSATVSQAYTGSINASGGVSPYTWTVNGATITNNGAVTISDGITVSNTGSNSLSIGGTPTTTGTVTLTNVKVTDSLGSTQTNTYTITVNNLSQVSGQFFLTNYCYNGSSNLPVTFTVGLYNGTTLVQSQTTSANGSYSFSSIPNGTYSIQPSLAGAATLFSPTSYPSVTLNSSNNNVTGENFNANVGFTVSGTVGYSGAQTGQTYLLVNNANCGGNYATGSSVTETVLKAGGAFTIRGVPPGSNTIYAWMDPLGQGVSNAIDPTGIVAVTVNANVSNANLTMADPTFTTPTGNPTISTLIPDPQGVLIEFNPSQNSNKVEDANGYLVQWSTSATLGGGTGGGQFATIAGSHTFTADGKNGVWILNNAVLAGSGFSFTSGQTYYFQARSFDTLDTANPHPTGWCNYTSSGCSGTSGFIGVTIGTPACTGTCTAVSSSVTIPAGITINTGAPLYLGMIQLSNANGNPTGIYVTEIASPVNGANAFTVTVPSGSNYAVVGILDQYKTGGFGAGTVSNTKNNVPANLTISGSTQTVPGITLPASNSTATVSTQWSSSTCQGCTGTSTTYQLNFDVKESNKLPVAVTLTSGPNLINTSGTVAIDMGSNCNNCGNAQSQYSVTLPGGTPNVGDTYDFTVTYLNPDGTMSQDTGSTVNAAVTGWDGGSTIVGASDAPTNLAPSNNNSTNTMPTFTWTDSSSSTSSDVSYSFYLSNQTSCSGNCTIWQIPGQNSNANGFSSSILSITWGIDPTDSTNTPSVPNLTSGDVYNWSIQVQDPNSNSAQTNVWYQP